MNDYEALKKWYQNYIQNMMRQNRKIIIDSFCEYYGEKYRSIIESRYDSISFVFYYENNMASRIINYASGKKLSYEMNKQIAKLSKFKSVYEKSSHHDFDNVIWCNEPFLLQNHDDFSLAQISRPSPVCTEEYLDDCVKRYIYMPILYSEEHDIIHEINHAITRDVLALREFDLDFELDIDKAGLEIIGDDTKKPETQVEELFNDLAAKEITAIFHRRGGSFGKICSKDLIASPYDDNAYLVKDVYDTFKESIKTARISDNKNAFVNLIGKENYFRFIHHVRVLYQDDHKLAVEKKEENMAFMKEILTRIIDYAKNENEPSSTLEDYYAALEEEGYKVTPINNGGRK